MIYLRACMVGINPPGYESIILDTRKLRWWYLTSQPPYKALKKLKDWNTFTKSLSIRYGII